MILLLVILLLFVQDTPKCEYHKIPINSILTYQVYDKYSNTHDYELEMIVKKVELNRTIITNTKSNLSITLELQKEFLVLSSIKDKEIQLYKLNSKKGDKWISDGYAIENCGEEKIKVLAGEFTTLHINITKNILINIDEVNISADYYLAPNYGFIKIEYTLSDRENGINNNIVFKVELKKFVKGEPIVLPPPRK